MRKFEDFQNACDEYKALKVDDDDVDECVCGVIHRNRDEMFQYQGENSHMDAVPKETIGRSEGFNQ